MTRFPVQPCVEPPRHQERNLHPFDLAVVVLYLAVSIGIGLWVSRHHTTAGDYFLGARDLPAWAILLSIVATETSALTVISVPGLGARGDLTFLQIAFGYLVGRIAVARWLLPGYFRGEQDTAYARLEGRFGVNTRRLASVVFMVTRALGDAIRVFASAIPLALVTGWSIPAAIAAVGVITLIYTWFGGFKAVVWTDVMQLTVYLTGGVAALFIAWRLAGGPGAALAQADAAGKLRLINPVVDFTTTYSLLGGLIGGGLLACASHGTDHLIVQRLLGAGSLSAARKALIGSGVVVIFQFLLFLLIGSAIWAAGLAPDGVPADQLFPRFVIEHLPAGLAGLVIAGILAAAMGTHSSAINSLASSVTHDLYSGWTGRRDPVHLLHVGRRFSAAWGIILVLLALFFHFYSKQGDTPVVVLALSIASVTGGGLLGTYILAGRWARATGRDAIGALLITVSIMLVVIFARRLSAHPELSWLAPAGRLAWPWYVPLGTLLTLAGGVTLSLFPHRGAQA